MTQPISCGSKWQAPWRTASRHSVLVNNTPMPDAKKLRQSSKASLFAMASPSIPESISITTPTG